LNEFDLTPRGMLSPSSNQPQPKSVPRLEASINSFEEAQDEYQRSPKVASTINPNKFPTLSSREVNNTSLSRSEIPVLSFKDTSMRFQNLDNSPFSKVPPRPQTLDQLENSGIKVIDQRDQEAYNNIQTSERYSNTLGVGFDRSPRSERRITFDVKNLRDIQELSSHNIEESSPQISVLEKFSPKSKGTEYASFRVSFGRTQSKYRRDSSPDVDSKDSLCIHDVAKRKRVTHREQTYDVVDGDEINYELKSLGPEYGVSKTKPQTRYTPQNLQNTSRQNVKNEKNTNVTSSLSPRRVENTPQN